MNKKDRCPVVDNAQDFLEMLKANKRVIALFYASWCPFCVKILPSFKKHAAAEAGVLLLVKDDREMMADQYDVSVYPTVLFFEMGSVAKRLDGILGRGISAGQLDDFIHSCA